MVTKTNYKLKKITVGDLRKTKHLKKKVLSLSLSYGVLRPYIERYLKESDEVIIMFNKMTPVGVITMIPHLSYSHDETYPFALFVHKDHRRQGIGKRLIRAFGVITEGKTLVGVGNTVEGIPFFKNIVQDQSYFSKPLFVHGVSDPKTFKKKEESWIKRLFRV